MGGMPDFGNAQSIFDNLGELFGDFFGGGRRSRGPRPGDDLLLHVELDLYEAAKGCKKTVTIPRKEICPDCAGSGCKKGTKPAQCRQCRGHGVVLQNQGFFRIQQTCRACGGSGAVITDPCPTCVGRGRVSVKRSLEVGIPAGVFSGARLPVRGEGEAGAPGAPRGDLYIEIQVREHRIFQRKDDHLICEVPVTYSQAALGAEIDIPTLDGAIKHNLDRGMQSGDHLRIAGKGVPSVRTGRAGDLLVIIKVETPKHLTKRQEELFRELAEIDKKHVSPERKSFFEKMKELFKGKKDGDEN
jgi:molecular chaperone DnaJ